MGKAPRHCGSPPERRRGLDDRVHGDRDELEGHVGETNVERGRESDGHNLGAHCIGVRGSVLVRACSRKQGLRQQGLDADVKGGD